MKRSDAIAIIEREQSKGHFEPELDTAISVALHLSLIHISLLGKVIQHQQLAANPFTRNNVPMHIPCKCPDGSAGLAQFAGFRCVK